MIKCVCGDDVLYLPEKVKAKFSCIFRILMQFVFIIECAKCVFSSPIVSNVFFDIIRKAASIENRVFLKSFLQDVFVDDTRATIV